MTSSAALSGLQNGDVTRTSTVARLIPNQKWRPEAVLAVSVTPSKPTRSGYDDSLLESLANPHLLIDAEQREVLDGESPSRPLDLPLCLHEERRPQSLRITKSDLMKYGYTDGCPRCIHTQLGMSEAINSNHWESCRRRVYVDMYNSKDQKLLAWLRDHPTDTAKVGRALEPSVQLGKSATPSSSSRSPITPGGQVPPLPPPPGAPGDLLVFENATEDQFTDVVNMLIAHGVAHVDAQRYVTSVVKQKSGHSNPATFFEVYGQGGLQRTAKRLPSLNVTRLKVLDLRTLRPNEEPWDFPGLVARHWL